MKSSFVPQKYSSIITKAVSGWQGQQIQATAQFKCVNILCSFAYHSPNNFPVDGKKRIAVGSYSLKTKVKPEVNIIEYSCERIF